MIYFVFMRDEEKEGEKQPSAPTPVNPPLPELRSRPSGPQLRVRRDLGEHAHNPNLGARQATNYGPVRR